MTNWRDRHDLETAAPVEIDTCQTCRHAVHDDHATPHPDGHHTHPECAAGYPQACADALTAHTHRPTVGDILDADACELGWLGTATSDTHDRQETLNLNPTSRHQRGAMNP